MSYARNTIFALLFLMFQANAAVALDNRAWSGASNTYKCSDITQTSETMGLGMFYIIGFIAGWNEWAAHENTDRIIVQPAADELEKSFGQFCVKNPNATLVDWIMLVEQHQQKNR